MPRVYRVSDAGPDQLLDLDKSEAMAMSMWTSMIKAPGNEGSHAIGKSELYLVDVLRAFPAEDGSIFVKRSSATRD